MEHLTIYCKKGTILGTKSRDEVHKDGNWHKVVEVWIINSDGHILMQKRSMQRRLYPGFWAISFAGHVVGNDTEAITAIKEGKEELGIEFTENDLLKLLTLKTKYKDKSLGITDKQIETVYLLHKDYKIEDFILDPEEVESVKYLTLAQFKQQNKQSDTMKHKPAVKALLKYLKSHFKK